MSILAKIHYEELIINIVSFNVSFDQRSDATGRPSQRTLGGLWEITFETRKNDPFLEYMVNESMIPYLKIVIQPAVLGSRSRTIEIRDVYVLAYRGNFNGIDNQPMVTYIELSPASMVQNGQIIFVKKWKITDPDAKEVEATKIEKEPKIVGYHIEDLDGNKLNKDEIYVGEEIILVIESSNAVGEMFEIDLDDQKLDYEHNGVELKDDILEVQVTNDIERIHLKAISQEN